MIDDDPQIREMLGQLLERAGYEVLVAPDGKEGLKLHQANPADLIITDIVMPEKEGLETIMEFRRNFPTVKIVAISGGGRIGPTEYLHSAVLLGAHRTFTKPFEVQELLKEVQELLSASGPEDS